MAFYDKTIGRVRVVVREKWTTIEYDPGWGWIARNPYGNGFRWRTRDIARAVVDESRLLDKSVDLTTEEK